LQRGVEEDNPDQRINQKDDAEADNQEAESLEERRKTGAAQDGLATVQAGCRSVGARLVGQGCTFHSMEDADL
jgi:hypothetical protein